MILIPLLASIFITVGVVMLLKLTPKKATTDILSLVSKKQSLRDKVLTARGKKKVNKLIASLENINEALTVTGKKGQFALTCTGSLVLMFLGGIFAILIDNIFMIPIFAVAFAIIPFVYAKNTIRHYEKHIEEEMETALSIITTSYIRSEDIFTSVKENTPYIKPPINQMFKEFLFDISINPNINAALYKLRDKINNTIFKEWIDTLIQCQSDSNMKDTLLPVVNKLTDVRIVNNELKTKLLEPKREYMMMVAMVVGNIPRLYLLNQSWYNTLMHTTPGKIVLAICGVVILVTALFLQKFTKPIEYRR